MTVINRFFSGIRMKFLVFSLLSSLIPFLILGFVAWYNYQKKINENVMDYTQQIMSLSATKLDDFLDKLDQFYYSVYAKNTPQYLNKIQENSLDGVKAKLSLADTILQLKAYYSLSHVIPYITIVSFDGDILYQNDLAVTTDYNFLQTDWFSQFVSSGNSSWLSSPQRLPYHESGYSDPSTTYMTYARKIPQYSVDDQPYFFLMEFNAEEISTLLSPLIKGEHSNLLILMNETPVYELNSKLNSELFDSDTITKLIQDSGSDSVSSIKSLDGTQYLINRYLLEHSSLSILCTNQMSEMMENVPDLKGFTLFLISISFFLTLLAADFSSKRLVRPIQELKTVTYEVRKGNLDVRVPALPQDEIGELGICIDSMLSHIRRLIQEQYQYSLREKEMQIHTLQAQINPHFLYNTLETISSIAENEGVDQISEIALSMADLYRYSITSSDKLVTLGDELNYINNYLNIMKVRYGQRLIPHFEISTEILDCRIMKLTLQPLIENAIYHGLEPKRQQGNLWIEAKPCHHSVHISIRDDGVGIPSDRLDEIKASLTATSSELYSDHIGILNVYQRMKLRFGGQCSMQVDSILGEGTSVLMEIPEIRD